MKDVRAIRKTVSPEPLRTHKAVDSHLVVKYPPVVLRQPRWPKLKEHST